MIEIPPKSKELEAKMRKTSDVQPGIVETKKCNHTESTAASIKIPVATMLIWLRIRSGLLEKLKKESIAKLTIFLKLYLLTPAIRLSRV